MKKISPFLLDEFSDSSKYLYCYKSVKSSLLTLSNRKLKFSPLTLLNDPLERAVTSFFLFAKKDDIQREKLLSKLRIQMEEFVEKRIQVLCFTTDTPFVTDSYYSQANRGFMRFRMWSQYADEGEGACFILNKQKLDHNFNKLVENLKFGASGKVNYTNDYLRSPAFRYREDDLLKLQAGEDIITPRIKEYYKEYLLTKRTDWAQEKEYRYFLLSDSETYIDIKNCLEGIALGYNYSKQLQEFTTTQFPKIPKVCIKLQGVHAYIKGF